MRKYMFGMEMKHIVEAMRQADGPKFLPIRLFVCMLLTIG
jgi:hypothetical protein